MGRACPIGPAVAVLAPPGSGSRPPGPHAGAGWEGPSARGRAWSTTAVSAPVPDRPGQPRWLVVLLAAGTSLLLAAVLLLVLQVAGVDRLGSIGFLLVVVVAAVAGGSLTRWLVPKLPPVRR
jgi:hypothetical protein